MSRLFAVVASIGGDTRASHSLVQKYDGGLQSDTVIRPFDEATVRSRPGDPPIRH